MAPSLPRLEKPMDDRFIRVKSGAVYRFSERLLKRKDAVIVTGQEAADYYRSINSENEITAKWPAKKHSALRPQANKPSAKSRGGRKPRTVVSDKKVDDLETLMESLKTDGDVRTSDHPGPEDSAGQD